MRKLAVILILFGSGLIAFALTGFSGEFSAPLRFGADDNPYQYSGSFGWPMNERIEITVGVISLAAGILFRQNSN